MDQSTFDKVYRLYFFLQKITRTSILRLTILIQNILYNNNLYCDCEVTYLTFFFKQQISLNQRKPLLIDELENGGRHFAGKVQKDAEW